MPSGALAPDRLPPEFADSRRLRELHLEAMRRSVGADYALYWRGGPPTPWDASTARWHDLSASVDRALTLFVARARGGNLLAAPASDKVKLGIYPPPVSSELVAEAEYTVCLDPRLAKAFYVATGSNLTEPRAVRIDTYAEIRRQWAREGNGLPADNDPPLQTVPDR